MGPISRSSCPRRQRLRPVMSFWTSPAPDVSTGSSWVGWPPDYHGTGSEEYFNSGWCQFDRKAISGFATLRPGHPTVYSFHLNDAFQFQHGIRVVEEQMGLGKGGQLIHETHPLWSSTAYWYALPTTPAGSH